MARAVQAPSSPAAISSPRSSLLLESKKQNCVVSPAVLMHLEKQGTSPQNAFLSPFLWYSSGNNTQFPAGRYKSPTDSLISPISRGLLVKGRKAMRPSPPYVSPKKLHRSTRKGTCRAGLFQDTPFVVAIGACILSSLVLTKQDDKKLEPSTDGPLGGDDVRNGAVTIISFIPLFNWLGWVFAWMDTNEQRYLFYACVYLAPYVRTGFSLSSDENWLLILSYMACIAHVQLEINLQTGGIEFGKTFVQDSLRQLQKQGRSELPGNQSRNFHESVSPDNEDVHMPPEEDFSQIELSEFDKKLFGMKKRGEDVEQPGAKILEDAEEGKGNARNSD